MRCEATSVAFLPSRENFFHHADGATDMPRRGLPLTRGRSMKLPRSLNTRTRSPSVIRRGAASSGWSSSIGSPSLSRKRCRLAKDEFRKLRAGGERKLKGYFFASAGLLEGSSAGGL